MKEDSVKKYLFVTRSSIGNITRASRMKTYESRGDVAITTLSLIDRHLDEMKSPKMYNRKELEYQLDESLDGYQFVIYVGNESAAFPVQPLLLRDIPSDRLTFVIERSIPVSKRQNLFSPIRHSAAGSNRVGARMIETEPGDDLGRTTMLHLYAKLLETGELIDPNV